MITAINKVNFSDAYHPIAGKFCEWWYFTFFYGQKNVISGIFKIENKLPEVWIFIKEEGQAPFYQRKTFPYASFSASTKHCDVQIGKNIFQEKNGVYRIKIDFPGIKLDVSFKKNFNWQDNLVARSLSEKEKIIWLVPCVRGNFTGKLIRAGKTKLILGLAFHDHIWHNINPLKMFQDFKGWFWAINYGREEIGLYSSVDLGGRGNFKFVFQAHGKKRLRIVDDPQLLMEKTKPLRNIKISYRGKNIGLIDLAEKESVNQWGNGALTKFFTKTVLGFSQYHCLGREVGKPDNWSYVELFQRQCKFLCKN